MSSNATALVSAGTISASHAITPDFIDIRTTTANKGVRVDLSRTPATIVVFEDSQNIEYPTVTYDVELQSVQAAYSLGGATLSLARANYDNVSYANGDDQTETIIAMTFAF